MASLYSRDRSPFWWLRHRVDGVWKSSSTGLRVESEEETAQAEVIRAEWALKETRETGIAQRAYSWEWVPEWLEDHCKSPKTLKVYQTHWKHIKHWISVKGIRHPSEITFKAARGYVRWRTGRRAGKKLCSKNNALLEVKLVGQIMTQCVLLGDVKTNPVAKLGIARDESAEKREFTDAELEKCLAAFEQRDDQGKRVEPEWMRLAFLIAMHTGCRLRETALPLSHIDFERMSITFAKPKGGRSKAFSRPLPKALVPVLEPLRARAVTHEIPFQPSRCFQNFFKRVGVEGVTFHCLRVTYVTKLHRAGVPLSAAMRLVNHSSEVVHKIYQKLNVEDVRAFADVLTFSTSPQNPTSAA